MNLLDGGRLEEYLSQEGGVRHVHRHQYVQVREDWYQICQSRLSEWAKLIAHHVQRAQEGDMSQGGKPSRCGCIISSARFEMEVEELCQRRDEGRKGSWTCQRIPIQSEKGQSRKMAQTRDQRRHRGSVKATVGQNQPLQIGHPPNGRRQSLEWFHAVLVEMKGLQGGGKCTPRRRGQTHRSQLEFCQSWPSGKASELRIAVDVKRV